MAASDILATNVTECLPESRQRWRHADTAVLSGEVAVLARRDKATAWMAASAEPLAVAVRMFADHPDWFFIADEPRRYRAGLGALIARRVSGLSNPLDKADTMLKLWSRGSQDQFVNHHLPRLLRQVAKEGASRVELGALFGTVANWDRDNTDIINTIAEEYFAAINKEAGTA